MPFLDELTSLFTVAPHNVPAAIVFHSSKANVPVGDGPYVTLKETGGTGPIYIHNDVGPSMVRPAAQVLVRAKSYPAARAIARTIYTALCGVRNRQIAGVWYQQINPLQEPFDLGLDDNQRAQVVFNVMATKQPS